MNYKNLILIALALCMCVAAPVAAVWQNGNWIADDEAPDVQFDSVTGVSSKYVPTDNSIPTDGCGALYIQTLTHHALIGSEFTLQRINPKNLTFVNGARIQKEQAEALETVAPANTFTLDHVGGFDDRYAKGAVFLVTLLDGNGGQSEYALAEMFEFQRTDVVFLGHGVSMSSTPYIRPNPLDITITTDFARGDINIDDIKSFGHWKHFWFFHIYVIDYIEVIIEVDRVHADVTNPNDAPVDADYNLDFNYYVDDTPSGAHSPIIDSASETYYGHFYNLPVGTTRYAITLVPSIENAVGVVIHDWDIDTYDVTVTNIEVTSTTWT